MRGTDIIVEQKQADKDSSYPVSALLFLMAGIYGSLTVLQTVWGSGYTWFVYPIPAVLCVVLWYGWFYRRKGFLFLFAGGLVSGCLAAFWMEDMFLLSAVLVSLVFFVLEIVWHRHMILYLLTLVLLLLAPLYGIRQGSGSVVLLLLFQITFLALHLSEKGGSPFLKRRSIRMTAVILIICLLAAFPLVSGCTQWLYTSASVAEGYVYRWALGLSGRSTSLVTGGRINGGNNYPTGAGHLELTLSGEPGETLYLRGFSGEEYIGGVWTASSDEAVFAKMQETLGWGNWGRMISIMYNSMYFMMNHTAGRQQASGPLTLTIRHLNGEYENNYVPYYSRRNGERDEDTAGDGYSYLYYESSDMTVEWDNVAADSEQLRDWYRRLQEAYLEEIQTTYTQVPEELLPRLTEFVAEHPLDDLDEISAFILDTLHNNATYTRTPGWTPLNEDIAEYFLFESRRGYCQQFALTATLLYRLYGVPARYATGYMVQPSDFEMQEDGTYCAHVTDESAHAWTEIFLEDYGWIPVETTPVSDGATVAEYPGFDRQMLYGLMDGQDWTGSGDAALKETEERTENRTGVWQETAEEYLEYSLENPVGYKMGFLILGIGFPYFLLLLFLAVDYRRLKQQQKLGTLNCRRVFAKWIQMLHFGGYLLEYDGSEEEFASECTAVIPVVLPQDILQVQSIVCEAAYGSKIPEAYKEEFVRKIYFQTADYIYGTLKGYRKFLFRYWKAF